MIINIRGTYGSGKTTLARNVMAHYLNREPVFIEGRAKPLYYLMDHPVPGHPQLAVVGSYETVCGGCDTIPDTGTVFGTVDLLHELGMDVLYESLLLTADVGRTRDYFIHKQWPLQIIKLNVPTEVCIASVNHRRRQRNPDASDVNPKNLLGKVAGVKSSCRTLSSHGIPIHDVDRDTALLVALNLLKVPTLL